MLTSKDGIDLILHEIKAIHLGRRSMTRRGMTRVYKAIPAPKRHDIKATACFYNSKLSLMTINTLNYLSMISSVQFSYEVGQSKISTENVGHY